jgi:hypothetical protein
MYIFISWHDPIKTSCLHVLPAKRTYIYYRYNNQAYCEDIPQKGDKFLAKMQELIEKGME